MYSREYDGRELNFEASGGLLHASLIMMDKETDSFWAIMSDDAIAGQLAGTKLDKLPVGRKVQWLQWKEDYPETVVLSVNGEEHVDVNPYDNYFASDKTFDGSQVADTRLAAKTPIYGFQHPTRGAIAIPHDSFEGDGKVYSIDDQQVFLYRPAEVAVFYSTNAYVSRRGFERVEGEWREIGSAARFDPSVAEFVDLEASGVTPLVGFDTFWFNWSMNNSATDLLK